jgi:hypothetical protein
MQDESGYAHYYNATTDDTSWDKPAGYTPKTPDGTAGALAWKEMQDESGYTYYYNEATLETSWEKPADLAESDAAGASTAGAAWGAPAAVEAAVATAPGATWGAPAAVEAGAVTPNTAADDERKESEAEERAAAGPAGEIAGPPARSREPAAALGAGTTALGCRWVVRPPPGAGRWAGCGGCKGKAPQDCGQRITQFIIYKRHSSSACSSDGSLVSAHDGSL